jgi:hypothetical protein
VIIEEGMDIIEVMFDKIVHNEVYFDRANWLESIREDRWL